MLGWGHPVRDCTAAKTKAVKEQRLSRKMGIYYIQGGYITSKGDVGDLLEDGLVETNEREDEGGFVFHTATITIHMLHKYLGTANCMGTIVPSVCPCFAVTSVSVCSVTFGCKIKLYTFVFFKTLCLLYSIQKVFSTCRCGKMSSKTFI